MPLMSLRYARPPKSFGAVRWVAPQPLFFVVKVAPYPWTAVVVLRGFPLLKSMTLLYGWQSHFAAAIALLRRQRVDSAILTGWDESAGPLGIAVVTRIASWLSAKQGLRSLLDACHRVQLDANKPKTTSARS